ncbi:MAG: methionine--tRNA ligase [Longimicrobiales bacterium]
MAPIDRFYITTAIDYANGAPHLGHALEKIGADAMARYRRLKDEAVHFVVGMDEHGLKVLQSAEARAISPQAWVDDVAAQFRETWARLHISCDDFIRTTDRRHHDAVAALIRRMADADDIYEGVYKGYYCVGCEAYKREEELEGTGEDARCPLHPNRPITWMEERNWFFRLSRYQQRLIQLLDERPGFVQPEQRRNEVRNVIESGLDDISVSRSRLPWGVPWPGDEEHTVYVWLDALSNYLAAAGFPNDGYHALWPADIHVIGKDITRFHCVWWPAFLLSADIELPETVWAHGFVNFAGAKLSKSEGVTFTLDAAIERWGADALRYYLLREIPWNGDGEVSWDRFDQRYTADLANDLGNLVNRTLSMIERYREGVVPAGDEVALDGRIADAVVQYRAAMDANLLHQGAAIALELAGAANAFVEERAPWKQAREPGGAGALDATLAGLARAVVTLATLLQPFIPDRADSLARRLGLDGVPPLAGLAALDLRDRRVSRGEVLFPKDAEQRGEATANS